MVVDSLFLQEVCDQQVPDCLSIFVDKSLPLRRYIEILQKKKKVNYRKFLKDYTVQLQSNSNEFMFFQVNHNTNNNKSKQLVSG